MRSATRFAIANCFARFSARLALPLILLVPCSAWSGGLTLEKSVRNLDPSIQSVFTCGSWKYGNQGGTFRVISGWLYGHTELYVQWVSDPVWDPQLGQQPDPELRVMATAVFPEFDDYEAATYLENVRCVHTRDGWAVTADADNSNDDGPTAKYWLFVYLHDAPGKFRLVTRPSGAHGRIRGVLP